ncbi:ABC transport system periplasmic substrate binding protein [Legionella beliardensis]|uniref:ABC transport system periplasmic substrate binding protein n=1 Tax=Legionella beliardensis TaxID=91822 RepID=A0A378I502_9GAMM|nr:MlaD family protein [Legionella beliardensis]STX29805.1 ABC transport system periplasmic substrate binding protein [Legionella beliardensis]
MEAKTNYTIVGLAVIILTSALVIAAVWLSVGFDKKKHAIYAVYVHEGVSGLSEESPVKYNGVTVGNVAKIELSKLDPQEVKLLLSIVEDTPVTTSTTATLITQGITGTTYVGLSANSSDLTPLKKLPQEPYPIIPSKPSLLNQLDKVIKDVSENVNSISLQLKAILDKENATNLKKSLANIESFTDTLAKQNERIASSLKSSDIFLKNMAEASKQFPQVIKDLKQGMNKLTSEVSQASQSITSTMDSGKETIDKISQQTIPSALALLRRLNAIAANLEKVSAQMRQNPSVIIRGTTGPKPGPGE